MVKLPATPEITALRTNLTSLTDTVTVGDTLQWFSNCLVERAFITQMAQGSGAAPAHKASQLIDGCNPDVGQEESPFC